MEIRYSEDGDGSVEGVRLTPQEVMRRGLLWKDPARIHPLLRAEVRRHQEAYLESLSRREKAAREASVPDYLKGRKRDSALWQEIQARRPELGD